MNISENNHWMRLALKEAQRSTGLTSPNPAVGAVIVKDGIVIARGRTRQVGGNHAERDALSILEAGEAKGATIYVTLEPCSTRGRSCLRWDRPWSWSGEDGFQELSTIWGRIVRENMLPVRTLAITRTSRCTSPSELAS